jgi:hypothetical protein
MKKLNENGEKILCSMFGVTDQNMISKEALKVHVVEQVRIIHALTKFLFRENPNHVFFEKVDEATLNALRADRFK